MYGETGRYPMYVNSEVMSIRYRLRILELDVSCFPKQAYTMLFNMGERGKKKNCWASDVRNILFSLRFGYVWVQQGVGCETTFISLFKQRLTGIFEQELSASILQKRCVCKVSTFQKRFWF